MFFLFFFTCNRVYIDIDSLSGEVYVPKDSSNRVTIQAETLPLRTIGFCN